MPPQTKFNSSLKKVRIDVSVYIHTRLINCDQVDTSKQVYLSYISWVQQRLWDVHKQYQSFRIFFHTILVNGQYEILGYRGQYSTTEGDQWSGVIVVKCCKSKYHNQL